MSRKGNPGAAFSSGLPTHQQQQPPATGGGVGSGAFPPSQTSSKQSSVGSTSNTASLGASMTSLSSAQQPPAPPISVVTSTNSAYAMINGIQLIRCLLPSVSERSCTVPVDASPNLQIFEDHGRFELNCLFYASADVSGSGTPFIGELIVDERITIYLGKLPDPAFHVTSSRGLPSTQPSQKEATSSTRPAPKGRGRSQRQRHAQQKQTSVIPESPSSPAKPEHNSARVQVPMCVARYVPEHPKTLALRVTHCVQEHYRHPEESALLEECQLLLLDRFVFGKYPEGLVPISVLQRNVEQLDVYRRVILEHYQGRWPIFLQQQVDELVIYPTTGAESRVGLKDREHAIATMLEDPFRTGRDAAAVAAAGGAVVVANEEGEEQGRSDEKPSLLAPTAGGGGVATGSDHRPPTDESGADESPATASLAVERQLKTEAERVIVTAMMEFLQAHGDVPYTELLAFLEKIPPFSRTLVPNHQYLYRFFNSHRDDFWITYDPIHSTRVGLVNPPTTKIKEEEK